MATEYDTRRDETAEESPHGAGRVDAGAVGAALGALAETTPAPAEIALATGGGGKVKAKRTDHHYASAGDASAPQTMVRGTGQTIVDPRVSVIFWGSEWTKPHPPTSPQAIDAAVATLCRSSYFEALDQYGYDPGSISYTGAVYAAGEPPASFVRGDVQNLVVNLIANGTLPHPNTGNYYDSIYVVMMPSTTTYGPGGLSGEHSAATWKDPGDGHTYRPFVAWIGNGTLDAMTTTLSHELVEAISDPLGTGWQVAPASPTSWNEVGDVCRSVAYLDGVAVQSYWSQYDGACVIPQTQYDSLFQTCPGGLALQVIAVRINFSRELNSPWLGAARCRDAGGNTYDLTRGQIVDLVDGAKNTFYVVGADGSRADVITASTGDHRYITTRPDGSTEDNLYALPRF